MAEPVPLPSGQLTWPFVLPATISLYVGASAITSGTGWGAGAGSGQRCGAASAEWDGCGVGGTGALTTGGAPPLSLPPQAASSNKPEIAAAPPKLALNFFETM
jgi:hypothetical protein